MNIYHLIQITFFILKFLTLIFRVNMFKIIKLNNIFIYLI